jgi:hypothetical protein
MEVHMFGGFVTSLIVFAIGAICDFAVTVSPYQHGFNIRTVGVILMIIGGVAGVVCLVGMLATGSSWRRRRTVVQDDQGRVVRREDSYI